MEKFDVWTVMYQKMDGRLAICNFVSLVDALKKVDELKDALIHSLHHERKAIGAMVIGNHKHLVIKGLYEDEDRKETAIIKIVPSKLCVPDMKEK